MGICRGEVGKAEGSVEDGIEVHGLGWRERR